MSTRKIWWKNLRREIFWYMMMIVSIAVVCRSAYEEYSSLAEPQSLTDFLVNNASAWGMLLFLTVLWWQTAKAESAPLLRLRVILDQYSFRCSLVLLASSLVVTLSFYIRCHAVMGRTGKSYDSTCIFVLPLVLAALVYFLPPVQICDVILPGGRGLSRFWRFVLVILLLAAAAWLLQSEFNFFSYLY